MLEYCPIEKKELNGKHIKRNFALFGLISLISLSTFISIYNSPSECISRVNWKGTVAICEDREGKLIAIGTSYKGTFPEGVTLTDLFYSVGNDQIAWFKLNNNSSGFRMELSTMNLENGKVEKPIDLGFN